MPKKEDYKIKKPAPSSRPKQQDGRGKRPAPASRPGGAQGRSTSPRAPRPAAPKPQQKPAAAQPPKRRKAPPSPRPEQYAQPVTQEGTAEKQKRFFSRPMNNFIILILLTIFQAMTSSVVIFSGDEPNMELFRIFAILIAVEWAYVILFMAFLHRRNFELEFIGFFLSGVGLVSLSSVDPEATMKQFITMIAGFAAFVVMTFVLGNLDFCMKLRVPAAIAALGLLAFTVLFAKEYQGAKNWISIGGFSIQPSEFVKVLFVFVGAATLEKIQTTKSMWIYIGFACACVGCLFLMKDFGAALIFFFTFLIIAFLQSGDFRTIIFSCTAGLLGAGMILKFKPYVMNRFKAYRHVWEYQFEAGWQQTNVLIGMASGGLFGLGIGQGNVRNVIFAQTDLMFGIICEEWGLLFGLTILLAFAGILVSAIKNSTASRSTFYTIASCAAAGLILFQASLNVFGVTDILPLTGVTLPFMSQGGSSIICCWALLAFIKASDTRTYSYLGTTRATPKQPRKGGKRE